MLRLVFFIPVLAISTTVCALMALIGGIFNHYGKYATAVLRTWAKSLLWAAGIKLEVTGLENVEPDESYILIANHQSHMDIPVLTCGLSVPLRIIAKKELFKIPFLGWGMKAVGMLRIDRSNRKQSFETLKEAEEIIKTHRLSILAFPEGTRSDDGKIHPFKKGPFVLAINTGLPLLPVSVSGTRKIIPKGKISLRAGRVKVYIHPPVATKNLNLGDRNKLVEKVQSIIEKGFIENYE
jgi:1-acyl-sn-glycerol-3-phosphate acyltransferase